MSNSINGFSTEEENRGHHEQVCCLIEEGQRCSRPAGNASYSKRIQKTVQQRRLKLNIDHSVRHIYICDYHKNMIQNMRTKRKRKESEGDRDSPDNEYEYPEKTFQNRIQFPNYKGPRIDFFQMSVNTLRRYKRHYKLQTRPGLNKAQLAETVARHFKTIPVVEKEALTFFIYMAKNYKSRFDQKHLDSNS